MGDIRGWTHLRVRESTKALLAELADAQDIGIDKFIVNTLAKLAELEAQKRFPLNTVPSDFRDLWGYPLIVWTNGRLYLCPHGAMVVVTHDGSQHWLVNNGHECDFKTRE